MGRHIPTTAQCPICRVGMEDSQHCLFTCRRAMDIWSHLGVREEIERAVAEDRSGAITMDVLFRHKSMVGELPLAELIAVGSWYIWWQRRQFVKGESIRTPDRTAISIKVLATNFVCAATPNQPVRKRDHMWKKPTSGRVKINVDAAFYAENMAGATGAVARDDRGEFIAAASWFIPHVTSADSAEANAIRNGLVLPMNIGCSSLIVESDSYNAVEIINQEDYQGQDVAIYMECKQLGADFSNFNVVHCFREANLVADSIAIP